MKKLIQNKVDKKTIATFPTVKEDDCHLSDGKFSRTHSCGFVGNRG